MVDFKKKLEEQRANMSPEQRKLINKLKRTEKDNIFYETKSYTVNENSGAEYEVKPRVYRMVHLHHNAIGETEIKVDEHLRLDFGGYWSYFFDLDFIERVSNNLYERPEDDFYVDLGAGIYIENEEMQRILDEAYDACMEQGIELVRDELRDRR